MEDVAEVFGQPQLLVVDLPYGDSEADFAQQGKVLNSGGSSMFLRLGLYHIKYDSGAEMESA